MRNGRNITNRQKDIRKRRNSEEIKCELLCLALKSVTKTQAMRRCRFSFDMLKRYIKLLTKSGLLKSEENNGTIILRTTEKGKEWIKLWHQLKAIENAN